MAMRSKFRILALEPDPDRGENLRRLIAGRMDSDVTIASSSGDAIAALSTSLPDLVLMSALVPQADDERLLLHLNRLDAARDVPILTVPPVVHAEAEPDVKRGWFDFLKRRRAPAPLSFDPVAVRERIVEAVARPAMEPARASGLGATARPDRPDGAGGRLRGGDAEPSASPVLTRAAQGRQQRARRLSPDDIPWLTCVQTPWGLTLEVVNISASGVLFESPSKFVGDGLSRLHLLGSERSLVVATHLVRSEVSEVTQRGVKYRTAARFAHQLDVVLDAAPRVSIASNAW